MRVPYVPMYADIALDMVNDFNNDTVTFSGHDSRPRELPIDSHHALCVAQPCGSDEEINVLKDKSNYNIVLACVSGSS